MPLNVRGFRSDLSFSSKIKILGAININPIIRQKISQIEGGERKGLIKEMGFNSFQNGVNQKFCSQ